MLRVQEAAAAEPELPARVTLGSLRDAVRVDGGGVPSTKGSL